MPKNLYPKSNVANGALRQLFTGSPASVVWPDESALWQRLVKDHNRFRYLMTPPDIALITFDFDGVFTDNKVLVDETGMEYVRCSRSDGLAIDAFKKIGIRTLILSSEKNQVVVSRAKKLGMPVIHGCGNKLQALDQYCRDNSISLANVCYVGNDVNDFFVMKECGFSCCPIDSHPSIIEIASFVLETAGGRGVARELAEKVFELDIKEILFDGELKK